MSETCIKNNRSSFFIRFMTSITLKKGLMGSTAVKEREGVNLLEL